MSIQSNINNAIHSIGTLSGLTKVITGQEKISKSLEDLQIEEYLKEDEARAAAFNARAKKLASFGEGELLKLDEQRIKEGTEPAFGEPFGIQKVNKYMEEMKAERSAKISMSAEQAKSLATQNLQDAQTAKAMKGGRHNQMRMRSGTKEEKTNE